MQSLWIPVLVSAALCWFAGALIWMVLPHHKSDYGKVDDEDAAREALRSLEPGQYNIPHIADPSNISDEDRRKFEVGPVAFLTVVGSGSLSMGKNLVQQIVYYVVVATIIAYLASSMLPTGASYLKVFQVTGVAAWLAYGFSGIQDSIWFGKPWASSAKTLFDALIYALLTAGVFGWLWP